MRQLLRLRRTEVWHVRTPAVHRELSLRRCRGETPDLAARRAVTLARLRRGQVRRSGCWRLVCSGRDFKHHGVHLRYPVDVDPARYRHHPRIRGPAVAYWPVFERERDGSLVGF